MPSCLLRLHIGIFFFFFFFFQAEDGIRDADVTGVQTCALPIWTSPCGSPASRCRGSRTSPATRPRWRGTCSGSASTTESPPCARSICSRRRRMSRRWRCWRGHDKPSAECGVRNAECQGERRSAHDPSLQFRIPHSTLRIRGGGGAVKYFVRIGAQTVEVEVDGARVVVGGEELEVHLAAIPGTPLYHLLLGGGSWTVAAQPLDGVGRWALGVVGERVEVEVADERTGSEEHTSELQSRPHLVC